jgi:hypothetical protein
MQAPALVESQAKWSPATFLAAVKLTVAVASDICLTSKQPMAMQYGSAAFAGDDSVSVRLARCRLLHLLPIPRQHTLH